MNLREQLTALLALQKIDSALDAVKKQYAGMDRGAQEKILCDSRVEQYKSALAVANATDAELRDLRLEMLSKMEKHKSEETRLYSGQVKNPRDLQDLQEEVDMLARQVATQQTKISELEHRLEAERASEQSLKKLAIEANAILSKKVEIFNVTAAELRKVAKKHEKLRKDALAAVPEELLKRYTAMRPTKAGVAIAPLVDRNVCSGCHMNVSESSVQRVDRAQEIVTCENCGRMLCLPTQPVEAK